MAQQHHGLIADATDPPHESLVIRTASVAMQLNPGFGDQLDVIEAARALGVARYLDLLRRRERAEDLITAPGGQGFELEQLLTHIDLGIPGQLPDLLDLLLEFHQRLLEIQEGAADHGRRQGDVQDRRWRIQCGRGWGWDSGGHEAGRLNRFQG